MIVFAVEKVVGSALELSAKKALYIRQVLIKNILGQVWCLIASIPDLCPLF